MRPILGSATTVLVWLASAATPACFAAPPEQAGSAALSDEFTLEIDGKVVDVREGEAVEVEVGGQHVRAKVTPKPERLFSAGGVSFRVPRTYSLEAEAQPDGSQIWTLSGNGGVIILVRHAAALNPKDVIAQTVKFVTGQYGAANVTTGAASIELGGRGYAGTRLTVKLAGQTLLQDVFAFKTAGATFGLIVQEGLADDGSALPETRRARDLLKETFRTTADRR